MAFDFYKGKKVLITGHTGFKGAWLSYCLLLLGAKPVGYALEPDTGPALFSLLGLEREMESHIGDIRDFGPLARAVSDARPDIVIHMAAQPIVRTGYLDPVGTYETNVMGSVNLLEACRKPDTVRSVVNVTTDKVYENVERDIGYAENEKLCGRDPYSNSKSCSELVTSCYRQSFFGAKASAAVSTARSGNVIGGGDFAKDRIIPDCIRAVLAGMDIAIRNPLSVRPYQHVLECLSGYLLLAEKQYDDKGIEGSFNFGPGLDDCVTTKMLVERFCMDWGEGASYIVQPDGGPHEAGLLRIDATKANDVLGWKPSWTAEKAVSKTVEWAKAWRDASGPAREITARQIGEYFMAAIERM
ncbi:MAG: CDP-glucose 4,6-dehydratase [Clostridiales Family XIII bacterium]|nr:CDP-glucose 4,6-dehydratase [Clostridiales Family XIII bacterium]